MTRRASCLRTRSKTSWLALRKLSTSHHGPIRSPNKSMAIGLCSACIAGGYPLYSMEDIPRFNLVFLQEKLRTPALRYGHTNLSVFMCFGIMETIFKGLLFWRSLIMDFLLPLFVVLVCSSKSCGYFTNDDTGSKMFIGGLNWETTDRKPPQTPFTLDVLIIERLESLKEYFSQFGEVQECTVMRDGATGRSRGFGFLTFTDPRTVNIVMVKEHYLDGKIVRPLLPDTRISLVIPSQFPSFKLKPAHYPSRSTRSAQSLETSRNVRVRSSSAACHKRPRNRTLRSISCNSVELSMPPS